MSKGKGMIFTHTITLLDSVSLGAPLSLPIACNRERPDYSGAWNKSPFKSGSEPILAKIQDYHIQRTTT